MRAVHPATRFYVADTLAPRHPATTDAFTDALRCSRADVATLLGTRDIWARDYMPVLTVSGQLVQFRYSPDYLRPKQWQLTITDGATVARQLGVPFQPCPLVVDGAMWSADSVGS